MNAAVRHPSRLYLVALTTKDDQVRGSGYLLNSRVVVTAGHVVEGVPAEDLRVCRLHTLRATTAEIVRIEKDIAVLLTAEDLAAPGELANVALRELGSDSHFGDCSALGLPAVMTRVTAGVAPLEAAFRVAPNSADNHGYLSLELDGHPPTGPEPWSGMSGAPVFHAGRWLIGVVVRDSTGWNHSRLEASPISALFEGLPLADALFRVRPSPPVTESDARDAAFLDTYRSETIRRYGHIELFGLGLQGHLADDISIDHAYVSLRAGVPSRRLSSTAEQTRPVEPLIAKNTRLLLRGSPGAGKSTLLEWLAVSMARGSCKGELEPFNDRIPFLLRLRDMYAPRWKRIEGRDGVPPRIGQFLEFSGMASDFAPPDGWIRRMLEQERALLLVDGLDEVLEGHRDGVLRWISDLLREFPALHVIVTGRPEALQHWSPPARLGFVELKLVELDADQRAELIHKWHQAAILGVRSSRLGDEERDRRIDRLSAYEISLTRHINASSDLSALAATPLLCAVLCKLHEVHGTRLPRFRQELYARTVDMMLGLRDADREVPEPLPGLDIDQRRAVLSWIAGYLTAEGEREITLTRFDEKVQSRLPSLGREASAHTPSEIRKALHERSGLLVAPAEDTLRFSHRTFQDYLAATDLVAQRSFGQLAGHAGEEMWDDVLRFAMSQCNLADTREFVAQMRRKARLVTNGKQRARMRLAAASCIPYAVQMGEEDRGSLIAGVAKTFRLAANEESKALTAGPEKALAQPTGSQDDGLPHETDQYASVGPDLLSALQRDFDWQDMDLCRSAAQLAGRLGGSEALAFLSQMPFEQRKKLASVLVGIWENCPGQEYADAVLAGLDVSRLWADSTQQLGQAHVLGSVEGLTVRKAMPLAEVVSFANRHRTSLLNWTPTALKDTESFDLLREAQGLTSLLLGIAPTTSDPLFIASMILMPHRQYEAFRFTLPPLPGVRDLAFASMPLDWPAHVAEWTSLAQVWLTGSAVEGIHSLGDLPALTQLSVSCSARQFTLPSRLGHGGVNHLGLMLHADHGLEEIDLTSLPTAFPALRRLTLGVTGLGWEADLTGLERMPDLRIQLLGVPRSHPGIRGAENFPKERIKWG
ncbi:serine protease [Streptomyces sp. NBC_00568]|uniref:serine protease n=1 Tax=Streptomyces sp. NBC_00568 TaxID=2975779 RepID=UPI00225815F2|nr:serine protease [Streptomyces sp. NBC_00568]MCX4993363.1 NACHT domain-containing protein [Streptomyces sp. NBC_00568]